MYNYNYEETINQELMDRQCPNCGEKSLAKHLESHSDGEYKCDSCGYEGNIEEDYDNENYFWGEVLCNYDEDGKDEALDSFYDF